MERKPFFEADYIDEDAVFAQLSVSTWEGVSRKYREMNHTIAAWAGKEVKPEPELRFYGKSDRFGSCDGMILHSRGRRKAKPAIIYINAGPGKKEILETIYHELLHNYFPDEGEAFVKGWEEEFMKGEEYLFKKEGVLAS